MGSDGWVKLTPQEHVQSMWGTHTGALESFVWSHVYSEDEAIQHYQLEVERLRTRAWGHSLGLHPGLHMWEPGAEPIDPRLNDKKVHRAAEDLMYEYSDLFSEYSPSACRRRNKRWGITDEIETGEPAPGFLGRWKKRNITTGLDWKICDQAKYDKLIGKIRTLNDKLLASDPSIDIQGGLRTELSGVEDAHHLQMLRQVTAQRSLIYRLAGERLAELGHT